MTMNGQAPVGVFDSGVGGLSVAREIRRLLPNESIVYYADTAHCPYGGRPLAEIESLSIAAARELVARGAKAIVVACNTASGAALEAIRSEVDMPVIGVEPAVKPAAASTRTGRIGVMATAATLRTERFDRLRRNFAREVEVISQPCPGLVELVEAGEQSGPGVQQVIENLMRPLREAGVDTVVLGCTHYPFLSEAIQEALGPGVTVIDSGLAVARQVERVLRVRGALAVSGPAQTHLLTTGDPETVAIVAERLWQGPISVERV
jgi:glutamate racemase